MCSQSPRVSGSEYLSVIHDSFQHCGPNGLHHCFVLEIVGRQIQAAVREDFSDTRLPKRMAAKAVREALFGLSFLHNLGIGHGGRLAGNFLHESSN